MPALNIATLVTAGTKTTDIKDDESTKLITAVSCVLLSCCANLCAPQSIWRGARGIRRTSAILHRPVLCNSVWLANLYGRCDCHHSNGGEHSSYTTMLHEKFSHGIRSVTDLPTLLGAKQCVLLCLSLRSGVAMASITNGRMTSLDLLCFLIIFT